MVKNIVVVILGTYFSVLIFMKLLIYLNKGDLLLNALAIAGIILLFFLIVKTQMFTNFKSRKK